MFFSLFTISRKQDDSGDYKVDTENEIEFNQVIKPSSPFNTIHLPL